MHRSGKIEFPRGRTTLALEALPRADRRSVVIGDIVRRWPPPYTWGVEPVTNLRITIRVVWFISIYFLTVLVLPLLVGATVSYRAMPSGRDCPHCRRSTLLLRSRLLGVLSLTPFMQVQRRWCLSCGWLGLVRVPRPSVRLVVEGRSQESGSAARIIDVRPLLVDGAWWTVRLETWRAGRYWYGRLLFVEPSGRLWPDGRTLRGESDSELLSQARRLPAGLLATRLRDLVSR